MGQDGIRFAVDGLQVVVHILHAYESHKLGEYVTQKRVRASSAITQDLMVACHVAQNSDSFCFHPFPHILFFF